MADLSRKRIQLVDWLRGGALVAMTIYHFAWDLEFFGWLLPGTINQPGWVFFARSIAASFLFLVGVSLVLAHGDGIRWPLFWRRFAKIAASALLISATTYFFLERGFVFFGILHAIALFSILALGFVNRHWIFVLVAGILILGIDTGFSHAMFDPPWFWWLGLHEKPPFSNDYVPIFPWLAPVLFGIVATRLLPAHWLDRMAEISVPKPVEKPLGFLGRHSLVYYLVHQPVLIGCLWLATQVLGPPDRTPIFTTICEKQCSAGRDAEFCSLYCGCVADALKKQGLLIPFMEGTVDVTNDAKARRIISQCSEGTQKHKEKQLN